MNNQQGRPEEKNAPNAGAEKNKPDDRATTDKPAATEAEGGATTPNEKNKDATGTAPERKAGEPAEDTTGPKPAPRQN